MKTLTLTLLTVLCVSAIAQTFEGTIKWTMTTEITDPATKAQIEKSKQMQNDPAMQEQLKQFQEQMKDPKMKEMMESNPQMKAQMEKMMKIAQSGDVSSMMPTGFVVKIKNMNSLTKIVGGMMQGEILYLHKENKRIQIDRENKTYRVQLDVDEKTDEAPTYKITKINESKKILGYTCQKYMIEEEEHGQKVASTVWATTEVKGLTSANFNQGMSSRGKLYFKEIDGIPLRIEMNSKEANMVMEAIELKRESLKDADFAIPADFTEEKGGF